MYILRWQLSTPILYAVMSLCSLPQWQEVFIANFIGALCFFPVDEYIFKRK